MPVFSKDAPLVDYVKNLGYLDKDVKEQDTPQAKVLGKTLESIRGLVEGNRPEYFLWGAVVALLAIIFTSKLF